MTSLDGSLMRWIPAILLAVSPALAGALDGGGREPMAAAGTVEVAFSPWDDAEGTVVRAISSARDQIYVQAFLLTSRRVADALLDAHARGVTVRVLADREMITRGAGSRVPAIAAAGVEVALEVRYQAAHNKIILVDPLSPRCAVLTGSYNFTRAAQSKNAENVVVMRGNRALSRAYLANWERHRADAVPYAGAGGQKSAIRRR